MLSIAETAPARQGEFYPLPSYYSVDAAALLAGIEEKALRREITGRPGAPLVSRSISHRAPLPHLGPLPPWAYFPPTGSTAYLRVYRKDVQVVRCHPETPPEARVPTPRAAIWEFSRKSRARLRHLCRNGGHVVRSQYLLTYHNQSPIDGRAVKRDLDRWLKAARRILGADLAYLWALEFQGRGVPHFHVFLSAPAAPGSPCSESWLPPGCASPKGQTNSSPSIRRGRTGLNGPWMTAHTWKRPTSPRGNRRTCPSTTRTWAVLGCLAELRAAPDDSGTGNSRAVVRRMVTGSGSALRGPHNAPVSGKVHELRPHHLGEAAR